MKIKELICCTLFFIILGIGSAQNFQWAKSIGGINYDIGLSITSDIVGNVYTTGYFDGTVDFDPGFGIFNLTSSGGSDIFIVKLDVLGNFVWAKNIGGDFQDLGYSVKVDAYSNVHLVGEFRDTVDFDPGPGIFNLTSSVGGGGPTAFILKLNSNGNFIWARQFAGASSISVAYSMELDKLGNIYSTGMFYGTIDFDPGVGTYNLVQTSSSGQTDIFISKLDSLGNFVWAIKIGAAVGSDQGVSITVDSLQNVYATGSFGSTTDFDPGVGVFNLTNASGFETFVLKMDSNANFIWAKNIASTSPNSGRSIAIDRFNNVYAIGGYTGTADFDPGVGVFNLTSGGSYDIFISKLDSLGNFVWSKGIGEGGTSAGDIGKSIAIDGYDNLYVSGLFYGTVDFDPGVSIFNLTADSINSDVFISKLDASGTFIWAKGIGGSYQDEGNSININVFGDVYTTGGFGDTVDFNSDAGILNLSSVGLFDIFIHKMNQSLTFIGENTDSNTMNIYPNPSFDYFNLSGLTKGDQINVYNIVGQMISETYADSDVQLLDLNKETKGIYLVKVISEKGISIKQIIKQ